MIDRLRARPLRVALTTAGAALALTAGLLAAPGGTAHAAGQAAAGQAAAGRLPCDVYRAGGTPCVGAYSTVRALYAAYRGPLYQVTRASDGAARTITPVRPGGVAGAAAQDRFCARTSCTITEVYDQSPEHNNLTVE